MKLDIDDPKLIETVAQALDCGEVVIMPCDTIYGFIGVAPDTEEKIRALKGREGKSLLRLIPDAGWLPRYTDIVLPPGLKTYWPGALTIIFPAKKAGTVALRIPADAALTKLMNKLGRALFSTSVNASGKPPLWRIDDILRAFGSRVALVVAAGDRPEGIPSTILDVTQNPFRLLRRGAVDIPEQLLEA
ncbi:MAG: L-threonylcarbamoyladenylate synthase [Spirochaetales bacterium]|nr:L-threonylcarbamoyladenylate synthase [Spirochaetales bacterium]